MKLILFSVFLLSGLMWSQPADISKVRQLYQRAAISATDARILKNLLVDVDSNSTPSLYCYKGAVEMVQAKYSINPMVKLESFSRGKAWIEHAISKDTANLEMRFIRFSIQSNLPAFLNYRAATGMDRRFLLEHLQVTPDTELKTMIVNYLKTSANLTAAELKGLSN
ncbi:hypothetical protein [Mucilaginibacter pedocola]|uniref:Uncharacterized protein n=1 Tax=Mucilaginibacter pedocola TaxID=1792845 RepID=A0A1S9P6S1_9SPHI|nr:hypothetical protein [Mucilaginibacter pedocola]OOQ56645.1 hypothetical protein BC343_19665 [Mucilaginibacter pedocola]